MLRFRVSRPDPKLPKNKEDLRRRSCEASLRSAALASFAAASAHGPAARNASRHSEQQQDRFEYILALPSS